MSEIAYQAKRIVMPLAGAGVGYGVLSLSNLFKQAACFTSPENTIPQYGGIHPIAEKVLACQSDVQSAQKWGTAGLLTGAILAATYDTPIGKAVDHILPRPKVIQNMFTAVKGVLDANPQIAHIRDNAELTLKTALPIVTDLLAQAAFYLTQPGVLSQTITGGHLTPEMIALGALTGVTLMEGSRVLPAAAKISNAIRNSHVGTLLSQINGNTTKEQALYDSK